MQISESAKKAIQILENSGHTAFLVGGCVRNFLLNTDVTDYDIATSLAPFKVKELFCDYKVIETGILHGTLTVIIDSEPIEITTFRSDGVYQDHRRPDSVLFSESLETDLLRRDFTVNALAFNEKTGIIDLFGGLEDINNKIIRAVGDAGARFDEDALRILRALRFASVLGFSIEEKTAKQIKEKYKLLKFVSKERIFAEIKKLLLGDNAEAVLGEYKEVFFYIFKVKLSEKNLNLIKRDFALRLAYILRNADFKATLNILSADNKTKIKVCEIIGCLKRKTAQNKIEMRYFLKDFSPSTVSLALHIKSALGEDISLQSRLLSEVKDECYNLKRLNISGKELKELNFSGKEIGNALRWLLDMVINERCENKTEELLKKAQNLKRGAFLNDKQKKDST